MVEQGPSGILYFFAFVLFVSAMFVFCGTGERITIMSVILSILFVVLGGGFVWLAVA